MRYALLGLPLLLTAPLASRPALPACGDAALTRAPDVWDPATAVTGDFTLDGNADVAFWKRDGEGVLLFVVACDGDRVGRSWRFRVALPPGCAPHSAVVQAASLLIDTDVVDRVCATGDRSECAHLRRENTARRATTDAGGRELRVAGPGCAGARLRWSKELGGFVRIS